jgi:TfoX/Sxy family transcriptional regulator of competence genes
MEFYASHIAEPYLTQLRSLAEEWMNSDDRVGTLEARHFFSGAALYRGGTIVGSLTPVGLAFKVPVEVRDRLLKSQRAVPLRYFPNSPVKSDYVLFPDSVVEPEEATHLLRGGQPDSWSEN